MRFYLFHFLKYVIIVSGFFMADWGMAQEPDIKLPRSMNVEVPHKENDMIGGIVIDQSVTFIGQNFYRAFVQKWTEMDPEERFTIVIKEHPTARFGSFIQVEYQGRVLYNTALSVRSRGTMAQTAEEATSQVMNTVVNLEAERFFQVDADLAGSEL